MQGYLFALIATYIYRKHQTLKSIIGAILTRSPT